MKRLVKLKKLFIVSLILFYVIGAGSGVSAEKRFETNINVINESKTDKGITLTVNSYAVKDNELTIQYSIGHDEKRKYNSDNGILKKPNIVISGSEINSDTNQIENEMIGLYKGKAVFTIPQNAKVDNIKFSVEEILNKDGSWNLSL